MELRRATKQDAPAVSRLMEELVGHPGDFVLQEKYIEELNKNADYYICVCEEQQEIIGMAMGILCQDICELCKKFMVVENVIVKEEFHGKGISQAIFQELERWSKENNAYYSIVVSGNNRKRAHCFYEKAGYEKVGGFRKMYEQ